MQDNRRASKRTRFFCEVELDGLLKARLSDLSPEGAFVESRTAFTPGAIVQLRFAVLGREIVTAAEIRHCSPGIGVGVRFLGLDPATSEEIAHLLAGEQFACSDPLTRPKIGEKVATVCPECEWHEGISIDGVGAAEPAVSLRCGACFATWSVPLAALVPLESSRWRLT